MPSIQETLRAALGADLTLAELVGDGIYPGEVPDDQDEPPWLYYALPEQNPFDELDGDGNTDLMAQVEFHSFAADYATAKAIIDAVFVVLDTYIGGQISAAFWRGTSESVEDEGHHHVARFDVWGSNANVFTVQGGRAKILTGADSITLLAGTHTLVLSSAGLLLDGGGFALLNAANTFIADQTLPGLIGQDGDLAITAKSGSGSNMVSLRNDQGGSVLEFSRNGGITIFNGLKFSPGNVYDIGSLNGSNSPREVNGKTRVSSELLHGQRIDNNGLTPRNLVLEHGSNDIGGAAGDGVAMAFQMKSSTTAARDQAELRTEWATATDASRKARWVLTVYDTAAREVIRGEASGSAPMVGFLGAAAVTRPNVTGSRGGNAALASLLTALANLGLVTDSTT